MRPEDGTGPIKILHRNHLLPLGRDVQVELESEMPTTPTSRILRPCRMGAEPTPEKAIPGPIPGRDTDSEDEDDWYMLPFSEAPVTEG